MIRTMLAVFAFFSAFFLPVWIVAIVGIVLATGWEAWEVILLGVLIDLLYMPPEGLWYIPMPATLLSIALVWVMIPIRKRIFMARW